MHFHFEEWQGVEISHVKSCGSIQLNFGVSDFFFQVEKRLLAPVLLRNLREMNVLRGASIW
jgi:hypothetical protein